MLAGMLPEIIIREARPDEYGSVHALVQSIADETFAYLFPSQVPIGEPNWLGAWAGDRKRRDCRRDYNAGRMGERYVDSTGQPSAWHRRKIALACGTGDKRSRT